MQIGASSLITTLPQPIAPRDGAVERVQRRVEPVEAVDQSDSAPQREITRIRSRIAAEYQQSSSSGQQLPDNVAGRNRGALQSYLNNGPTIEERLGVELVGLDIRV